MKINQWTFGLAAAGVISLAGAAQAEEAKNQVLTAVSGTTLSGYVSTSARWDFSSANAVSQYAYGGGAGASKSDRFSLDVVDLTIAKNPGEGDWAAGYKAELWVGPDAAVIGNNVGGLASNDLSLKQAYVALRAPVGNGLDLKVGVFDTIIGYESANGGDNPNYSRSWGYTLEPTQHQGVLASYRFCDSFSATAGVANSHVAALNTVGGNTAQSQKTYMAAVTFTAPDSFGFLKGATLTAGAVDGRTAAAVPQNPDLTTVYVGATIPTPVEALTAGFAWDHLNRDGGAVRDVDAIAAYLSYKASDKLKLNIRADYLDNNGALPFVAVGGGAGTGGSATTTLAQATAANNGIEVLSTTFTADYALWENVISRLEYRWDHAMSGRNLGVTGAGNNNVGPFNGGRVNTSMIALNIIYKF